MTTTNIKPGATIELTYGPTITVTENMTWDDELARMNRAFALVCPLAWGRPSWKSEVVAVLTEADLAAFGVTLAEVHEAIEFFTATKASQRTAVVAAAELPKAGGPLCWIIKARGYYKGPAN